MEKYPVRNVIFEGKCYMTSAILDAELSCTDCIEDLVVDTYYGEFLKAMKSKRNTMHKMYKTDTFFIKYYFDDYNNAIIETHRSIIKGYFYDKIKFYNHDVYFMNSVCDCRRKHMKGINKLAKLLEERR